MINLFYYFSYSAVILLYKFGRGIYYCKCAKKISLFSATFSLIFLNLTAQIALNTFTAQIPICFFQNYTTSIVNLANFLIGFCQGMKMLNSCVFKNYAWFFKQTDTNLIYIYIYICRFVYSRFLKFLILNTYINIQTKKHI